MKLNRYILYLLLFFISFVHAQKRNKDSLYIKTFKEYFAIKLSSSNNAKSFTITSPNTEYTLSPQSKQIPKIGLNYQFISVQITLPIINYINNFDSRKGKTKTTDIGLNIFMPHWHHYFLYQKTEGYYLKNTQDFIENWNPKKDDYIQFSDMVYREYSGVSTFALNPNFSLKSLTNQSEKQRLSLGSFVPSIAYKYYTINNQETVTANNGKQNSNNLEFILHLGYMYNYVLTKSIFLSAGVSVGPGYKYTKLSINNNNIETSTNHNNFLQTETYFTLGYDNSRFYGGFNLSQKFDKYFQKRSTSTLIEEKLKLNLYFGYRFDPPKKIDHYLKEKIMKKYNIK
ncbi:hypothetical protein FHR24_001414 [Wenyingzhuangia heitensis]|uniref:DUF4421 domain-containing protein n=1 Tax=Wenyingzhuangia heitensis TaxID=1487859 RepID=A0ABX0UAK0_9FLAO|nr:DUF4421 family protein [Wenyingzhuangia heitensis]NIJ44975.1 hypothetical protein [Wenyingzhuangia heitensis]